MLNLLFLIACTPSETPSGAQPPDPASANACIPTLGGGLERPEGPTVSRVDWLAGTTDGSRVAMLITRDGYRVVQQYALGSRETEYPDAPADPAEDADGEAARLRGAADWLHQLGLDANAVPDGVPWCQDGERIRLEDRSLSWELWDEPCEREGATRQWRICLDGTDRRTCAEAPLLPVLCWDEPPRLVDIYALGGALWFLVERPREHSTPRMAAGLQLP